MLSEQKKNEILAILWSLAALLLFLCLVSYTPDDVIFEVSTPSTQLKNWVGFAGAYTAWILRFLVGQGAYCLVALFLFWAMARWSGQKTRLLWLKILSGCLFFVSACGILALLTPEPATSQFAAGGLMGYFAASALRQLFGPAGIIVASAVFLISLLLATEFMVLPLFVALGKAVRFIWNAWRKKQPDAAKAAAAAAGQALTRKDAIAARPPIKIKGLTPAPAPVMASTVLPAAKPPASKPEIKPFVPSPPVKPKPAPAAADKSTASAGGSADRLKENKGARSAEIGAITLPPISLLKDAPAVSGGGESTARITEQSRILEETLADFSIDAKVVEVEQGPVITRFELQPASGVRLQRITALQDNIALALSATSIRILAPIPGKSRIGIEVPNPKKHLVVLKDILLSAPMQAMKSRLAIALGKDAAGEALIADLDSMPHLLIAGSTGSGKTVCVNSIIMSLLYRATPDEVRMILIDPKMVELINYNGLPHLLSPVITQVDKVPSVLGWLVGEMERRYRVLSTLGAREVEIYNERYAGKPKPGSPDAGTYERMPYIVCLIDELADLMMSQGKDVETAITRLAQLARAVGIHMVLATQRPSVDVITGVIKANFPARLAFQVTSKVDSRTVLDANGADCLLGKGDLLFMDPAKPHLIRGQGAWVTDEEISRTVEMLKAQAKPIFQEELLQAKARKQENNQDFRDDEHYDEACRIIVSSGMASVSMLQRRLGLGYTRAARLVDMMEEDGIVGPSRGAKPRDVLLTIDQLSVRQAEKGHRPQTGNDKPAGASHE